MHTLMSWRVRQLVVLTIIAALFHAVSAQDGSQRTAAGTQAMVATAHPLATSAALKMLQGGGNAVDAAVAAAFVIGVVEPDGSGLGGGGGMVIHLADEDRNIYINYYQRAGEKVKEVDYEAERDRQSARAAIIPGTVAGLTLALEKYGTMPLSTVLEPAIRHAEEGFAIDKTLAGIILDNVALLSKYESTAQIFLDEGFPRFEGDQLVQPELARTLREIAAKGRSGFYEGRVASEISSAVARQGGSITLNDLKNYTPTEGEPVHGTYRGYNLYSAATPQSGVSIVQALNMLERVDLAARGHFRDSAAALHLLAETLRRVYADRSAFIADPDFEEVPERGLLSKEYARQRFEDIDPAAARPARYRDTKAGDPQPFNGKDSYLPKLPMQRPGSAELQERYDEDVRAFAFMDAAGHTTHLSVVDARRNAVSLTQTLGTFFGSGLTVAGVLLNNSRANFSRTVRNNALAPGKQPRSSISPTIVTKDGDPVLVVGSPGATRITATVVQLLVNVLDYGMSAADANDAPRFFCQKFEDYLHLEARIPESVRGQLKALGHPLQVYGDYDLFFGGAQMIRVDRASGTLEGSADPRRGGSAEGF